MNQMLASNSVYHPKLLEDDFQPVVTAYYFRQWENYNMEFHHHNAMEIMYVVEGSCSVETATEKIELRKHDFIFIDADAIHRLLVGTNTRCRMLNIEFGFEARSSITPSVKQLAAQNEPLNQLLQAAEPYLVMKASNEFYETLKMLILELDDYKTDSLMVQIMFSELLIRVARLAEQLYETDAADHLTEHHVNKALAFIHQHYDQNLKVQHIAENINLHPSYFHRIFKAYTGVAVMEYLTDFRLKKAKMLLAQTDMSISEISYSVGINSSQYFSTLFKKHSDVSPLEYRRASIKNARGVRKG